MPNITRRRWLGGLIGASLSLTTRLGAGQTRQGYTAPRGGIRHVLQIVLPGGIDQVFTTAPREKLDVNRGVDVPYAPGAILHVDNRALGPHVAGIARHASRVTFLHGVRNYTAGHPSGTTHVTRLRTRVSNVFPAFVETFGGHRRDSSIGSVLLAGPSAPFAPDSLFGGLGDDADLGLRNLMQLESSDLRTLSASLVREAAALERLGGNERRRMADHLRACAALYSKLPTTAPVRHDNWGVPGNIASPLQSALWLLENDLSAGVLVSIPAFWDTHADNTVVQAASSLPAFAAIGRLVDELERRSNTHGLLIDQTLILIGSEMGRFPRLNARNGKDHSPEIPLILLDPALPGHSFGALGRELEALPIALQTGLAGTEDPMTIDDVGTTLLGRLGMAAEPHGYSGRRLRFLEV